jgi:hypothetical protein
LADSPEKLEGELMNKISTYAFVLAACLGTTAMLAHSNSQTIANVGEEGRWASDGAFRDGLYLGRLSGEGGQPSRLAIGRWSTDQDRSMFAAGYHRGYTESLAAAATIGGEK